MQTTEVERIAIGVVRKPHGVQGGLKVTLYSIDLDMLQSLEQLFVKSGSNWKSLTLKTAQGYDDYAIIRFSEIADRTEADTFRDQEIYAKRDELPNLEDDEFYADELVGCDVIDENRNPLGKVIEVLTPGAHEVLVVQKDDVETLVPLVEEWVTSINIQDKSIQVNTVEEIK